MPRLTLIGDEVHELDEFEIHVVDEDHVAVDVETLPDWLVEHGLDGMELVLTAKSYELSGTIEMAIVADRIDIPGSADARIGLALTDTEFDVELEEGQTWKWDGSELWGSEGAGGVGMELEDEPVLHIDELFVEDGTEMVRTRHPPDGLYGETFETHPVDRMKDALAKSYVKVDDA